MKTKKYFIDYGTGAGNDYANTLEEAMQTAEDGMRYTQRDVNIIDTESNIIAAASYWCRESPSDDDDDVLVQYGDFGFFTTWHIC